MDAHRALLMRAGDVFTYWCYCGAAFESIGKDAAKEAWEFHVSQAQERTK